MATASEKITYVDDIKAANRQKQVTKTPDPLSPELGERIMTARKTLGLTRNGLAEHTGISRKNIQKWETGEIEPRLNQLSHLAGALNVSLVWLMTGKHLGSEGAKSCVDRRLVADATLAELRSTRTMMVASLERLSEIEAQVEHLIELK